MTSTLRRSILSSSTYIPAHKRFDMLILPGQRHGFGDMNEYFFWRMADYFSEHLLGSSCKSTDIPELNNDVQ